MRAECVERFGRERVANKSIDPVSSRIAGWISDEQFLEVADLLKLVQSQTDVHIAETFRQPKKRALQANAERLCESLRTERPVI